MRFSLVLAHAGAVLGAAIGALPSPAVAGELRKASDALHSSSAPSSSSSSSNDAQSSSFACESSTESESSSDPTANAEPPDSDPLGLRAWSMLPAPYASGASGYMVHVGGEGAESDVAPPRERRIWALQFAFDAMPPAFLDYGRLQVSARVLTSARLELDASYGLYLERGAGGGASSAWLGKAHLDYRFLQSERVQARVGAGVRHWLDERGGVIGPDALFGMDIFWGPPIATSLEVTAAAFENGAWIVEPRMTIGWVIGAGELFAGYDAVWVGTAAYLGGPIAGARAFF